MYPLSVIDPDEAAEIRAEFRVVEDTMATLFWDITWYAWSLDRPDAPGASWYDGTADETWYQVASGTGRLSPNGTGGPTIGDGLIYLQAPYRLRCRVADGLATGMRLVIENRLFKVEFVEDRAGERQHANAYLTEIFGEELPEVTP